MPSLKQKNSPEIDPKQAELFDRLLKRANNYLDKLSEEEINRDNEAENLTQTDLKEDNNQPQQPNEVEQTLETESPLSAAELESENKAVAAGTNNTIEPIIGLTLASSAYSVVMLLDALPNQLVFAAMAGAGALLYLASQLHEESNIKFFANFFMAGVILLASIKAIANPIIYLPLSFLLHAAWCFGNQYFNSANKSEAILISPGWLIYNLCLAFLLMNPFLQSFQGLG